jgi:hypothetical protein
MGQGWRGQQLLCDCNQRQHVAPCDDDVLLHPTFNSPSSCVLCYALCRWALQGSQRLQGSKLMRSVEAYESACGFIDATNVDKWRLLHLNAPAVELLGACGGCTHAK